MSKAIKRVSQVGFTHHSLTHSPLTHSPTHPLMKGLSMRLPLFASLILAGSLGAAEWVPVTTELLKSEKPGYGGLCGVCFDPASGTLFIELSDKGIYQSMDQGKNWKLIKALKGRTETPGCMMLDPSGGKRMAVALVYGSPIILSPDLGQTWKVLSPKSGHVDWCAVDWTDKDLRWILTLKHESGGVLLSSHDGGMEFTEIGKGYGPAWIYDKDTAVVAEAKSKEKPKPGIVRTTDAGKTFEHCADFSIPMTCLPRAQGDAVYWIAEDSLIASTDKGKSWKKLSSLKEGRCGPVFGKDGKHFFVLAVDGILESTDGSQTWSKPIAVPGDIKNSKLSWLAYDAKHDTLYVMKMGSELYKMERK